MKKMWVSVKRGLIRDNKHRVAMGESVWLFLYMLDIVDWETGVINDWKDEAAAEDMQMPVRTLREQRRKLAELDYVICNQKQYSQSIVVNNWTNPREYSGETYNKKQGGNKASPQKDGQDYTQDYTQGSTQDVTPTYDSKNQISKPTARIDRTEAEQERLDEKKMTDIVGAAQEGGKALDACVMFEKAFGFGKLPWDTSSTWQKFAKFVREIYESNPLAFGNYAVWRADPNGGKYSGYGNKKIRDNPQAFMDTGWPEFELCQTTEINSTEQRGINHL